MGVKSAAALFFFAIAGPALGWKECAVQLSDRWEPAEPRSIAERLLIDYERRYTCTFRPGSSSFGPSGQTNNTLANCVGSNIHFYNGKVKIWSRERMVLI